MRALDRREPLFYNMIMIHNMNRTTIVAEDSLLLQLRAMAQRQRVSLSELIRRALRAYVGKEKGRTLSFVGAGSSGGGLRLSERDEEILFRERRRSRP